MTCVEEISHHSSQSNLWGGSDTTLVTESTSCPAWRVTKHQLGSLQYRYRINVDATHHANIFFICPKSKKQKQDALLQVLYCPWRTVKTLSSTADSLKSFQVCSDFDGHGGNRNTFYFITSQNQFVKTEIQLRTEFCVFFAHYLLSSRAPQLRLTRRPYCSPSNECCSLRGKYSYQCGFLNECFS